MTGRRALAGGDGCGYERPASPIAASTAKIPTVARRRRGEGSSNQRPAATRAVAAASPTSASRPGALNAASTGEVTLTSAAPAAARATSMSVSRLTAGDRHARAIPTSASAQTSAAPNASGTAAGSDRQGPPDQKGTTEWEGQTLPNAAAPPWR